MAARLFLALCVIAFIPACATFKRAELDPKTGQFPSLSAIADDEIKVNKPLAGVKTLPFVYLRTLSAIHAADFDAFVRDSLEKIGFPKPISEQELTQLVVRGGLTGEVQSLTNVLSLHRLSQAIGPFLVAEFRVIRVTVDRFRFDVVIVDPVNAETVFAASRRKISWVDFDKEFSNPMMNAVKRWFDASAQLPTPERAGPPPGSGT